MDNKTINRKVAVAIGLEISEERTEMFENLLGSFDETDDSIMVVIDGNIESFDPCNVANDAWPIIISNGITIGNEDGYRFATNDLDEALEPHSRNESSGYFLERFCTDDESLRAAMICFLKMKDAENA